MISTAVIILTILMAAGFLLVYWLKPGWREKIEQPKHCFQEQLQRYDNHTERCHEEKP